MQRNLIIRGGDTARRVLRERGFDRDAFSALLGASGGPKWLVLSRMDRVLAERFVSGRRKPLNVLGSSIGTFRHSCFAMREPLAAIERFEKGYMGQVYETRPTPSHVTDESRRIFAEVLGENGVAEILANETVRTHVIAARSRWATSSESRLGLSLGLAAAAVVNAVSRPALAGFFERVLFSNGPSAFGFSGFGTIEAELNERNLVDAVLASGSIPLVMSAIHDIDGVPAGVYRDGGIVDYHFDFEFTAPEGLLLYPHFTDRIVPGWFDKALTGRTPGAYLLDRVVRIAPSPAFVASLPGGKIPDRTDFEKLGTEERLERWNDVVDRCGVLADELEAWMDDESAADRVEAFQ